MQTTKDPNDRHHQIGRREFVKSAMLGGSAMALGSWIPGKPLEARPAKRPNIVFLFPDQTRQDMQKFIDTPNKMRMAREGMTFANSFSTTPLCTPYRGMLYTGRYPTHSGIVLNWINANARQNPDCLANVFDRAGYTTALLGKFHLTRGIRVASGMFSSHPKLEHAYLKTHPNPEFVPPGPQRLGFQFWQAYNFDGDFNHYWYYEDKPQKIYSHKYETDTIIDQTINYIEKHKNDEKPFLLVAAPHPPHEPWALRSVPDGYLDKIPPAKDLYRAPNVPKDNDPMQPEKLRYYLAMAKNFDDNLGRLLDYLDHADPEVRDNTILVFSSDHGEMGGSHGRVQKMVPYTEALNVPLIMRWPGKIPAGVVSDALYTPIDHLTTLCGLAGIKPPSMADGQDLSDVVLGRGRSYREAVLIANYTSHWDFFQTGTTWPEWRGVHTKRYTYVKWLAGKEELYDNLEDPFQMHNLVAEQGAKETLLELRWRLKELMVTAHDDFLNGRQYASWYTDQRNLVRTALGPVPC